MQKHAADSRLGTHIHTDGTALCYFFSFVLHHMMVNDNRFAHTLRHTHRNTHSKEIPSWLESSDIRRALSLCQKCWGFVTARIKLTHTNTHTPAHANTHCYPDAEPVAPQLQSFKSPEVTCAFFISSSHKQTLLHQQRTQIYFWKAQFTKVNFIQSCYSALIQYTLWNSRVPTWR